MIRLDYTICRHFNRPQALQLTIAPARFVPQRHASRANRSHFGSSLLESFLLFLLDLEMVGLPDDDHHVFRLALALPIVWIAATASGLEHRVCGHEANLL